MHITINGKQVGVKFNQFAYNKFNEYITNKDFAEIQVYAIVLAGYQGWKFLKEEAPGSTFVAPEISFEEVMDFVDSAANDEAIYEQLKQVRDLFTGTPIWQKILASMDEKKSEAAPPDSTTQME